MVGITLSCALAWQPAFLRNWAHVPKYHCANAFLVVPRHQHGVLNWCHHGSLEAVVTRNICWCLPNICDARTRHMLCKIQRHGLAQV